MLISFIIRHQLVQATTNAPLRLCMYTKLKVALDIRNFLACWTQTGFLILFFEKSRKQQPDWFSTSEPTIIQTLSETDIGTITLNIFWTNNGLLLRTWNESDM